VIYSDERFECEKGLITGYTEDKLECNIVGTQTNATMLTELDETLIIGTVGEEVSLSCPEETLRKDRITYGLYQAVIPSACTMAGQGWKRAMQRRPSLAVNGNWTKTQWDEDDAWIGTAIKTKQNNIDKGLPPLPAILSVDLKDQLDSFRNDLSQLNEDDLNVDQWYNQGTVGHHLAWTTIGMIVLACICALFLVRYLYKRRKTIRLLMGTKGKPPKVMSVAEFRKRDEKVTLKPAKKADKQNIIETVAEVSPGEV
jgi:hypothetical protein